MSRAGLCGLAHRECCVWASSFCCGPAAASCLCGSHSEWVTPLLGDGALSRPLEHGWEAPVPSQRLHITPEGGRVLRLGCVFWSHLKCVLLRGHLCGLLTEPCSSGCIWTSLFPLLMLYMRFLPLAVVGQEKMVDLLGNPHAHGGASFV